MILEATHDNLSSCAKILQAGGVVAIPTETVYGLAANALDDNAVKQIFSLKGRPATNPLIIHARNLDALHGLCDLKKDPRVPKRLERVAKFWPGPLTVVVPKLDIIPSVVTAGLQTVALRIPAHPIAQDLLVKCQFPLAAPSANRSTELSPTCAEHVESAFADASLMILDGGPSRFGLESTVISLIGEVPNLLRPGSISSEELSAALGERLQDVDLQLLHENSLPNPSPGMLQHHYQPKTPVIFRESPKLREMNLSRVGFIAFSDESLRRVEFDYATSMVLSSNGKLEEVAANLYSALHRMDELGLDLIIVDSCEERGIGKAIMNRLMRAVA